MAVKNLVKKKLHLMGAKVTSVRKLSERDVKMMVLVEYESEEEAKNILKNVHN